MDIEVLEFIDGAKKARGVAVIIDVFRAFSVACYAFDAGAERVITTANISDAFELKAKYRNAVLAGERKEKRIEGFDFGNSPTEIIKADLKGKTFIHTTSAGTQGLANAVNADVVLTGSFVNARAVANYITRLNPDHLSLVAMGFRANETSEEDLLCAEYISSIIMNNEHVDITRIGNLRHTSGKRFFIAENIDFAPPTDFFLCTMADKFNFVLNAIRRPDGNVELFRIDL